MKKILALSVAILATTTVTIAQQSKIFRQLQNEKKQIHMQLLNMLLKTTDNSFAGKPTTLKQRVIAQSSWDKTGAAPVLRDSAAFGYSSNYRGSEYNYNWMTYYFNYPASSFINYAYLAGSPYHQDIKADSLRHWTDNGSGLMLYEEQHFVYDAANRPFDFIYYDYSYTPADGERYIHTYDAQGRLTMRLNLVDNAGTWDTSSREFLKYNAQNKPLLDSIELYNGVNIWSKYGRFAYTYDVSGNATNITFSINPGNGTLVPVVTYDNTFYSNNMVKTSRMGLNQTGAGVDPYYADSFGYTPGISYYTYVMETEYDVNTALWSPYYLETRHINSQALPDTLFASKWDGTAWAPASKTVYTYNSYNDPEAFVTYGLPAGTIDHTGAYYYEAFNDLTAVNNVPAITQDIKVYPNPTGGTMSINWSNAVIGAPVTISIVGMNGQMVYSESLRWNQTVQQLSIGHLQPGIYTLVIASQQGKQVYRQQIVKQ